MRTKNFIFAYKNSKYAPTAGINSGRIWVPTTSSTTSQTNNIYNIRVNINPTLYNPE